jgi:hypothetical protein
MGNSVVGATGARSLPIFGAGSDSSPLVREQRNTKRDRVPPRAAAAERRAAALDVNVDRMLIGASLRASKRLRTTWPQLSAATLGWRSRAAPLLLLVIAFAAMLNASSTVALSVLVVLPAAFRIWIVVHPTMSSPDESADTQDEQEPVYSVIVRCAVKLASSISCSRRSSD